MATTKITYQDECGEEFASFKEAATKQYRELKNLQDFQPKEFKKEIESEEWHRCIQHTNPDNPEGEDMKKEYMIIDWWFDGEDSLKELEEVVN